MAITVSSWETLGRGLKNLQGKRDFMVALLAVATVPLTWLNSFKAATRMGDYNPVYRHFYVTVTVYDFPVEKYTFNG